MVFVLDGKFQQSVVLSRIDEISSFVVEIGIQF